MRVLTIGISLCCIFLLSGGCGKKVEAPVEQESQMQAVDKKYHYKSEPDEHGVVCYYRNFSDVMSCVKVK